MIGKLNYYYTYERSGISPMYEVLEITPKGDRSYTILSNLSKKEAQDMVKRLSFSAGTLGKKLPKLYVG